MAEFASTYSATLLPTGYTAVYRRLGSGERGSIRHDEGTTYVISDSTQWIR
jgi:hypothetical protein